jgi:hypothetical protein
MGGAILAGGVGDEDDDEPSRAGGGARKAGEVGSPMNRQPKTFSKKTSARSKLTTLIWVKAKADVGLGEVGGWDAAGSGVREDERRDLEVVGSDREPEESERRAFILSSGGR